MHKTYSPFDDQWVIRSSSKAFNYFRTLRVCSKELSKSLSKLVISITLCQQFFFKNNLEIFRMEIQNASTTSSKSNQLRNVITERWESGNVTTQPWKINNWKSEVIAFVVNAGMNVTANDFYI